jgi:serine/threonine protein kinase
MNPDFHEGAEPNQPDGSLCCAVSLPGVLDELPLTDGYLREAGVNRLGKYRILRRLGKGGMGVVYLAEDTLLQRPVAVKILSRVQSSTSGARLRFLREARAAATLSHPNVVAIHEIDQHRGTPFIVMELLEGGSAADLVDARGPLPWVEATRLVAGACRGLVAAHAAGLLHRDIKPANILLDRDGTAKLADFGLVCSMEPAMVPLTRPGQVLGTPSYMSPEQGRGEPIDDRSDVYSLGATYYTLLTGELPYSGDGALEVLFAHCTKPIPDPRDIDPTIPASYAAIVRRALAKEPADRYSSAAEMLAALEEVLCPRPTRIERADSPPPPARAKAPGRRLWLAVTVALGLLGLLALAGALLVLRGDRTAALDPQSNRALPDQPRRAKELPLARRWPIGPGPGPTLEVGGEVEAIAFAPRGRVLAVASGDAGVHVWDWTAQKEVRLWPGQGIRSLVFSPDAQTLAAGARGAVRLRNLREGQESALTTRGVVLGLTFSPDGKTLAAAIGSAEREGVDVLVWDFPGGKMQHMLQGPSGSSCALAFSAETGLLAVGGEDGAVALWDLPAGRRLRELHAASPVRALAFSPPSRLPVRPQGRYLAIATDAGLQFWDVRPGRWNRAFNHPTGDRPVTGVAYSPDGRFWAFAYAGGKIRFRNNLAGKTSGMWGRDLEPVVPGLGRVAFAPDGKTLAAVDGRAVRLWDLSDR